MGARWAYNCFCSTATTMAQLETALLVAPLISFSFFADMIASTGLTDGSGRCGTTTPATRTPFVSGAGLLECTTPTVF